MASDSLCSDGRGFFVTTAKKLYRLGSGAIVGTSGAAECRNMLMLFDKVGYPDALPSMNEIAAMKNEVDWLLVLLDNSVWSVYSYYDYDRSHEDAWESGVVELNGPFAVAGHGGDFAKAALEAGASLENAIKVACKNSLYCALPIQTLSLYADNIKPKKPRKKKVVIEPQITTQVSTDTGNTVGS